MGAHLLGYVMGTGAQGCYVGRSVCLFTAHLAALVASLAPRVRLFSARTAMQLTCQVSALSLVSRTLGPSRGFVVSGSGHPALDPGPNPGGKS